MAARLMISLAEARALLLKDVTPCAAETLPIAACHGRVLASDVIASRDQPPTRVSAMDGYAVRATDVVAGAELRVVGEAVAGAPFAGTVGPGEAVRIATGGVVPDGADHIVIQEEATRLDDTITQILTLPPNAFIRAAGCDFAAGAAVAGSGAVLTPARLALAAAANLASLDVVRRPRVAILASGDELREPGSPIGDAEIVNSAAYGIAALVEEWGGVAARAPILVDDPARCEEQLRALDLAVDVIVTLGGASVGDRDSLRPLFARLGAQMIFEKISVQPGKPTWHAVFSDRRLVLGLPGNPASAFVCAHLLLKPLLFALAGRDPGEAAEPLPAILTDAIPSTGARETYLRAAAGIGSDGRVHTTAMTRQDSSLLTPLAAANGLIRRHARAEAAASGDIVELLVIGPISAHPLEQETLCF